MSSSTIRLIARAGALASVLCLAASAQQPIGRLPYYITQEGSYVVTQNLSGPLGIVVGASHVTLDLGGYMIAGTADNASDGILVRGLQTDLEIRNGTITGWNKHGIMADDATNSSFHDLRVSGNVSCGLRAGAAAVVERVVSQGNTQGSGIVTKEAGIVKDSIASSNAAWGIDASYCNVITGNTIHANGGGGILASDGSRVYGNSIHENGHGFDGTEAQCGLVTLAGLVAMGGRSYLEDNVVTDNKIGLQLMSGGNVVARNVVKGNGDNYDLVAGNQLEILLGELPESIDWPARVVLAGTLYGVEGSTGLDVNADGVSIDLGGHGLLGVPGSMCGIFVDEPIRGLTVTNGFVSDWDGCGVRAIVASDSRFEDLLLEGNALAGLRAGKGSVVTNCAARSNGLDGILTEEDSIVSACSATLNGNDGINVREHSLIVDSVASENTAYGFRTGAGAQVRGSTASGNNLGIFADTGSSVVDNTVSFNADAGIRVGGRCMVRDNTLQSNQYGIFTSEDRSRIEANTMVGNAIGLDVVGRFNLVLRNSASANGTDWLIGPDNSYGPIIVVAGLGEVRASEPWTNFSF